METPHHIDDVIAALRAEVATAQAEGSPAGYFPALYARVTVAVKEAIAAGAFEDGPRMERLDVIFARRYLDAVAAQRAGRAPSQSWAAAFTAAHNPQLIVLQHLLLGMNAHISFDLGLAAAAVGGRDLMDLKTDFFHLNEILGGLIDDTQARLTRLFGPLGCVDRLLGPIDEQLSLFSLSYARDRAWSQALEEVLIPADQRAAMESARDAAVARFAQQLIRPPRARLRLLLWCIRRLERGDVRWRLAQLS